LIATFPTVSSFFLNQIICERYLRSTAGANDASLDWINGRVWKSAMKFAILWTLRVSSSVISKRSDISWIFIKYIAYAMNLA
jgi:hypothetical protein